MNIRAGVIFDASGNLYGTSILGGAYGCGAVFKLTHETSGSWPETNLFDFNCGSQGSQPIGGLVFDNAGNLYGTTISGGTYNVGVVYELTPSSSGQWSETVLHEWTAGSDGGWGAPAPLIFDSHGALYGVAAQGALGTCAVWNTGCGVAFKMTPGKGSWTYDVLHSFTGGSDGGIPQSTLIFDKAGNLYGTTYVGGTYGYGVTYELIPHSNAWTEKVLHEFRGGSDGNGPFGGVIFDSAGNLYGTTIFGGDPQCTYNPGCGLVYELEPNSNGSYTEHVLTYFIGTPNNGPTNDLVMDSRGNLYGTGTGYNTYSSGTVYEVVR